MTNDANDDRPRDADSAARDDVSTPNTSGDRPSAARARAGWSDADDDTPASRAHPEVSAATDRSSPIKGTPTPGHPNPTGRREDAPSFVARPLGGTTPKATNEPPQAPTGAGSSPTVPKPVDDSPRSVSPETAGTTPSAPAASPTPSGPEFTSPTAEADDVDDRPDSPFAPKPEESVRKPLWQSRRKPADDETVGKRAATRQRAGFPALPGLGGRSKQGADTGRAPLGSRNVIALAVTAVALVAVVALIASTAVWWFSRDTTASGDPSEDPNATPGPVLSADMMLTPEMATLIDPTRKWTQTLDQAGVNDSSPNIACVGPLAADQPIPEITQLRGLTAGGTDRTAALHRADAYATNEEAQKVFEFRSAELGSCTDTPLYVEKGLDVTGLGDQALGVRLVLHEAKPEYHSVLLVRTGKVVALLDVARVGEPVNMEAQVRALGQSVDRQCGPAVGLCTAPTTSVKIGVPPAGGAQPGLLTSGDIPRISAGTGTWRGNPPAARVDVQDGSSCEAVDFASVGGTGVTRQQRTYLLRNDPAAPPQFGIDQVVLTMGSAEDATNLVNQINGNMTSCNTRTLTSQMSKEAPLITPGQDGVEIRGHWYIVQSKVDAASMQIYRVGLFSAGNKFIYLRSNPTATFDFTDEAWIGVNLRAGERITQLKE